MEQHPASAGNDHSDGEESPSFVQPKDSFVFATACHWTLS
jgi:hypothetical protein